MTSASTGCCARRARSGARASADASVVPRRCGGPLRPPGGDRGAAASCARATSSTSSPSTARTRPAASASPRRSWRSCSTPAPTSSRSATTPSTRRRPWSSSSARSGCCGPINYPPGTPGKGAGLFKAAQRRRRAGHQRHGPRSSCRSSAARSAPWTASSRPAALKQGRRRHRHRLPCRGDQREAGLRLLRRRAGQLRRRHAHACAHRGRARAAARHGLRLRYRHVRRLRIGAGHGPRRAAQPIPDQDPARAIRAGHGPGHHLGAGGGDRRLDRPCAGARQDCGSVVFWHLPSRCSGSSEKERVKVSQCKETANSVPQL